MGLESAAAAERLNFKKDVLIVLMRSLAEIEIDAGESHWAASTQIEANDEFIFVLIAVCFHLSSKC